MQTWREPPKIKLSSYFNNFSHVVHRARKEYLYFDIPRWKFAVWRFVHAGRIFFMQRTKVYECFYHNFKNFRAYWTKTWLNATNDMTSLILAPASGAREKFGFWFQLDEFI